MIFKKPYAFFIKYFRIINLILTLLYVFFVNNLWKLHNNINKISNGSSIDYSILKKFVGFYAYLLLILISIILVIMIVTLKRKNKPHRDYLYGLLYNGFCLIYFISVSNLFLTLESNIVEVSTLRLYKDVSFLIIIPIIYFIIRFILVTIGFDIKKFNFSKDITEIKQDEKDNEEVELVFDKNTYKYKRGFRKSIRELKYYFFENKFLILIIVGIILGVTVITTFSFSIFDKSNVRVHETFKAGNFSFKVNKLYETKYDLNSKRVRENNKFVIMDLSVTNLSESSMLDFKRIRLFYGDSYVYPNDYFNKYFYDIGTPYSNSVLKTGENYNYIFIFEVPDTYKSNNYVLKFFDKNIVDQEYKSSYKKIKVSSKNLDTKKKETLYDFNEKAIFDKNKYGDSNIVLKSYDIKSNFIVDNGDIKQIIRPKSINNIVLLVEYELSLDSKYNISKYFTSYDDFIKSFCSIEYVVNDNDKTYDITEVLKDSFDNKTYMSVPYEVLNATSIKLKFNVRDNVLVYNLK